MSSDIYPPNLSRNLVSTGTFGYRENAALCLLMKAAEDSTRDEKRAPRRIMNFLVFPSFDLDGHMAPRKDLPDASHLHRMVASLENYPPAGPPAL